MPSTLALRALTNRDACALQASAASEVQLRELDEGRVHLGVGGWQLVAVGGGWWGLVAVCVCRRWLVSVGVVWWWTVSVCVWYLVVVDGGS